MREPETDGQVLFVNPAVRVVWSPAGFFLKKTDGPNAAIGAEVEPM
jgi:hypothetical protein